MAYGHMITHEASGATLAGTVARPDIDDAADVFTTTEGPHNFGNGWDAIQNMRGRRRRDDLNGRGAYFNGGLIIERGAGRQTRAYNVELAQWAVEELRRRSLDDLSFDLRAIPHDNGWTLILANYDRIIGSVWLAYVKSDSLPK